MDRMGWIGWDRVRHARGDYHPWQLTAKFAHYLLTTRCYRDHASHRQGKPQRLGRGSNSVEMMINLLQVFSCMY